jgi:hypothetical protein
VAGLNTRVTLDIGRNALTPAAAGALGLIAAHCSSLNAHNNAVGDAGCAAVFAALAEHPLDTTTLALSNTGAGPTTARAAAAALSVALTREGRERLTIDLRNNPLTSAGPCDRRVTRIWASALTPGMQARWCWPTPCVRRRGRCGWCWTAAASWTTA